jgi:catecholate siderophore receptor
MDVKTSGGAIMAGALAMIAFPAHAAEEAAIDDQSTIVVTGQRINDNPNADPDSAYKIDRSANGKFTEPLRDTPKTVTVIPKEVIEDLGAQSLREVIRSTPGVTLGTGEGGNAFGDRIFIRGFEARNDVYIDGLRDPGVTSREIFAVEQIEVVKGPSSSFGGRGTTGGSVSLEFKRPYLNNFVRGEATVGTENHYRATVDVNQNLGGGFAVRLNGLYHSADTPGRDFVESERYGVAASALYQPFDGLELRADYYHYRLDGIPDFGHPFDVATQRPYKVDRDNFYGVIGRDFLENGADIATISLAWQLSDTVRLRSMTRHGETYNRYLAGAPGSVCRVQRNAAGACPTNGVAVPESEYTLTAGGQRRYADNKYLTHLTDATMRFDTGGIGHTLVAGFEYAKEQIDSFTIALPAFVEDSAGNPQAVPGSFVRNLLNPNPVLGFTIPHPLNGNPPVEVQVKTIGLYLLDTIKISEQWEALLGIRYDDFALDYLNPNATGTQGRTLSNDSEFVNYQASLIYKPVEAASIYASFSTSSNPSGEQLDGNGIAYDGISLQTQELEPERNTSYELGAKYEVADGNLLLTAAAFQITKDNARENVGNNVFELVGELRARGLELGVSGNVTPRLALFGGYTYLDAKIRKSTNPANEGRRFANVPQNTFSMLATYKVTDRFTLGGQAYYQDEIFGGTQAAGTASTPGYWRFDAVARYLVTDHAELRLNVLNFTDKTYYDAIYRSGSPFAYVAPGRSAHLSLALRF